MPALHVTSRSPPPESCSIHSPHSTHKVLSTFRQHPQSSTSRPLSQPIQLRQLHHQESKDSRDSRDSRVQHPEHPLSKIRNQMKHQFSFDETENISNPRLPSTQHVQSATLPQNFLSSKRLRKSRSSDKHICGEEVNSRKPRITPPATGDDADSESDSIDSIYKRLSGPQSSPHPIPECVRATNISYYYTCNTTIWIHRTSNPNALPICTIQIYQNYVIWKKRTK